MTEINASEVSEELALLIDQLIGSPASPDYRITVERGFERKSHRSSRDLQSTNRHSSGDQDAVVVTVSSRSGDPVVPVRGKGLFWPEASGSPAVHLRVELGPQEPLAQRFLAAAAAQQQRLDQTRLAELKQALDRLQNQIDELQENDGITEQEQ